MTVSPITLVFTLLGGLLLAGILGWVRRARLIVLVPRLFSHSNLTSRGQLAEITVFNRGFKTEEAIELILNQLLQYEVVGSNSPDTSLSKAKLIIPRVGPGDEITTLLLVEGGAFSKADIISCLSKETKGIVVAKLEEVAPTGPQRIGLVSFFVVVPLALYAMTFVFDYVYKTETPSTKTTAEGKPVEEKSAVEIQGWMVPNIYKSASGELYKYFTDQKVRVSMLRPIQKRDAVSVSVIVENLTSSPITYTLSINAAGSQERVPFEERRRSDVFLLPQAKSEARLTAIIPADNKNRDGNTLYVECFLENTLGDSLKISRLVVVN